MIELAKQYQNAQATAMNQAANLSGDFDDLINLSIGDLDQITDEAVMDAAMADAKAGHTKYTHALGDLDLRLALKDHFESYEGVSVLTDQIMITAGAGHGLYLALKSLINPGDQVLVPSPYYPPYLLQVEMVGGVPVEVACRETDNFHLTVQALEKALTPQTRALILNNPNNPTGASLSREELSAIVAFAKSHHLVILADEVYRGYSFDKPFTSIYRIPGAKDCSLVIGAFSKDYAMTGWRVGYVFGPKRIIDCMQELNEAVCFTACSVSQRAAIHALHHHDRIQKDLREAYQGRLTYVYERVEAMEGLSLRKPEGTFYVFINIQGTGLSSEEFCQQAMDQARVLVLPGTAFGESGEGYIRMACTVDLSLLKEAFDRLEKLTCFNQSC